MGQRGGQGGNFSFGRRRDLCRLQIAAQGNERRPGRPSLQEGRKPRNDAKPVFIGNNHHEPCEPRPGIAHRFRQTQPCLKRLAGSGVHKKMRPILNSQGLWEKILHQVLVNTGNLFPDMIMTLTLQEAQAGKEERFETIKLIKRMNTGAMP